MFRRCIKFERHTHTHSHLFRVRACIASFVKSFSTVSRLRCQIFELIQIRFDYKLNWMPNIDDDDEHYQIQWHFDISNHFGEMDVCVLRVKHMFLTVCMNSWTRVPIDGDGRTCWCYSIQFFLLLLLPLLSIPFTHSTLRARLSACHFHFGAMNFGTFKCLANWTRAANTYFIWWCV